jgi:nucleotide-binding universal stress UspA family protein
MAAKPVVVGVDGSEGSLRAVEWAAQEAERRKSPLRIVSAPAMPPRMHAGHEPVQTVADELREFSLRALGTAVTRAEEVAPGLLIDTDLLSGAPARAITDAGAGALLLVAGARGIGGFAALILGSVSRYAATHAPCPVVVVRATPGAVHREVVVGVRDASDAAGTLAFAFDEAALRGADLIAVHVSGEAGAEELTEILNGWRDKYPGVTVRPEIVSGHPGQVLAEYSARADLVVIGRHGGSGASHAIGSAQHAVLNHANGPVAVIPRES